MSNQGQGRSPGRESAEARRERLAAELRANLTKRKAQARARAAAERSHEGMPGERDGKSTSEA